LLPLKVECHRDNRSPIDPLEHPGTGGRSVRATTVDAGPRGKLDPSELIQHTVLEAVKALPRFRGRSNGFEHWHVRAVVGRVEIAEHVVFDSESRRSITIARSGRLLTSATGSLPMRIPYARKYTATLTGTTLKRVQCESCHAEFVYQMERTAKGSGTSMLFLDNQGARGRAGQNAQLNLRGKLAKENDVVPCPACGSYQANMVLELRREHGRWMRVVGIVLLVMAMLPLGFSFIEASLRNPTVPWSRTVSAAVAAAFAGTGAALLIIKVFLSRHYDPNSGQPDARIALGRSRAVTKERLEKLLREQGRSAGTAPSSSRARETADSLADPGCWEADDPPSS
jgi:hypothetical protein